jgi:hypothetical protein
MFVQTATSGTFVPNAGAGTPTVDGTPTPGGGADFLLTLEGHAGGTIYFSDRPDRIFGESPTQAFLDGLGFTPANPPNAALVAQTDDGTEDVAILELLDPTYDADTGTLTYGATLLGEYEGEGLAHVATRQQDDALPQTFGRSSLFIDSCSDHTIYCEVNPITVPDGNPGSLGKMGFCYNWAKAECLPCAGWAGVTAQCNATFPDDCQNQCDATRDGPAIAT